MRQHASPHINSKKKRIEFYFQNDCARQISLVGSFNHWSHDLIPLKQGRNGEWKVSIPLLPNGKYYYKFLIDDRMWVEDVENLLREPDGVIGWNSVLTVETPQPPEGGVKTSASKSFQ